MADPVIQRFYKDRVEGKPSALPSGWDATWTEYIDVVGPAMIERRKKVTITARSTEGASTTGVITGDPREICESLQSALHEAAGQPISVANHVDRSCTPLEIG